MEKHGWHSKVDMGFNEDGTNQIKNVPDSSYNDIETGRVHELAKSNITHNSSTFSHQPSHASWKALPSTFVYCTKDMALTLDFQEGMVKDARDNGAVDLVTVSCDSGHCPFLSLPAEVVRIVKNTWKSSRSNQNDATERVDGSKTACW